MTFQGPDPRYRQATPHPGAMPVPHYAPPPPRTNTAAVVAVVLVFACAPAAVVLGLVARHQIARTGEKGRRLAIAGIVGGLLATAIGALFVVLAVMSGAVHTSFYAYSSSVPGTTVARQIVATSNGRVTDADCPELPGSVGAQIVCTAAVDGTPDHHLRVTTTAVDGDGARFDFTQID